jgi:ClpP class serine protease
MVEQPGGAAVMDVFWLIFLLSMLAPVVRQRVLEVARLRRIARLERQRQSRVIVLVHRQETMRLLGVPLLRYLDVNDSEEVLRAIQLTDDDLPLDVVLHTPGGLVLAAAQIATALRAYKSKVTVFIPHYAMSGGTLITLAAAEIVMSRHAVLGPVDPQLNGMPAASLITVATTKPIADVDDETLVLADVGRKAITQVRQMARLLLDGRIPAAQADVVADQLSSGKWTHDYPISAAEAKSLGLPVSTNMPKEVLELMALYPQPVRAQGSGGVEYLPGPRRKSAGLSH